MKAPKKFPLKSGFFLLGTKILQQNDFPASLISTLVAHTETLFCNIFPCSECDSGLLSPHYITGNYKLFLSEKGEAHTFWFMQCWWNLFCRHQKHHNSRQNTNSIMWHKFFSPFLEAITLWEARRLNLLTYIFVSLSLLNKQS